MSFPPAMTIPIPPILLWSTHRTGDTIIKHSCSQTTVHLPMEDETLGRWLAYCDTIYNTTEPELGFEPKYKAQIAKFKYKLISSSSLEDRQAVVYSPVSVDQVHLMSSTAGLDRLQGQFADHGRQISKLQEGMREMKGRMEVVEHKIQQQVIKGQSYLSRQWGRLDSWSDSESSGTTSDEQNSETEEDINDEEWDKLSTSSLSHSVDLPITQGTQEDVKQGNTAEEDLSHPTANVERFTSDSYVSNQNHHHYPNISQTLSDMGWILQNYHEAFIRVSQDMEVLRTSLKDLAVQNTGGPTELLRKIERLESESQMYFANDRLTNERLNEVDRLMQRYEGLRAKVDEQHYEINWLAIRLGGGIESELGENVKANLGRDEQMMKMKSDIVSIESDANTTTDDTCKRIKRLEETIEGYTVMMDSVRTRLGRLEGPIVGSGEKVDKLEEPVLRHSKDQGGGTSLENDLEEAIGCDTNIPQDQARTVAQFEERLFALEKNHSELRVTVSAFRKQVRRRTINMGFKLAQINDEFHIPNIHMRTSFGDGNGTFPQLTTRKISHLCKSEMDDWLDFYDIPKKHLSTPRRKRIALYAFLGGVPKSDTFSGES